MRVLWKLLRKMGQIVNNFQFGTYWLKSLVNIFEKWMHICFFKKLTKCSSWVNTYFSGKRCWEIFIEYMVKGSIFLTTFHVKSLLYPNLMTSIIFFYTKRRLKKPYIFSSSNRQILLSLSLYLGNFWFLNKGTLLRNKNMIILPVNFHQI